MSGTCSGASKRMHSTEAYGKGRCMACCRRTPGWCADDAGTISVEVDQAVDGSRTAQTVGRHCGDGGKHVRAAAGGGNAVQGWLRAAHTASQ